MRAAPEAGGRALDGRTHDDMPPQAFIEGEVRRRRAGRVTTPELVDGPQP